MDAEHPSKSPITDFRRLRSRGIWLPVGSLGILIGFLEIFGSSIATSSSLRISAYLVVMGVIAVGAYFFSYSIFRLVDEKEREIVRRNQELAALNTVGAVINESSNLDGVLNGALDSVLEVTGAESGEILLWDEESKAVVLRSFRGLFPEAFHEITRFELAEGLPGRVAETGKAIVVHNLPDDSRFLRRRVRETGFQSYAGLPLQSKGKLVGVMGVFALDPGRLTSNDVELLEALGRQIGVVIENARLDAQLKALTVAEERHRIAREMHDGLAQELGYLYVKVGELEGNLSDGAVREELRQVREILARAYEEVRHAIFGLKMTVARDQGLVPTLTEYLHEFSEQTGITAKLRIVEERATRFSPQAEIQLIRIIQEALSNARKYAQASEARVVFELDRAGARVSVEDDGRGFDPAEVMRPGRAFFGLHAMRERAESIGGSLEIESQRGGGTRVSAWIPLGGEESATWSP